MRLRTIYQAITIGAMASLTFWGAEASAGCESRAFDAQEATMLQAYVAYYGRPADPGGLYYWAGRLAESGGNLDALIDAFGTSPEFVDRYGSLDNTALVTNLYQQIFGRAPDQAGLEYYASELTAGNKSLGAIALDIANGAQNEDKLTLDNRTLVAGYYVSRLETLSLTELQIDGDTLANILMHVDSVVEDAAEDCGDVDRVITSFSAGNTTIQGTAAAGLAIASGTVQVTNANGDVASTTTSSTGTFSIEIPAVAPYMLKVTTQDGETTLYSWAGTAGTTNITTLTNLATYVAAGGEDLASAFESWAATYGEITQEEVEKAIATINANFEDVLTAAGLTTSVNFFSESFNADGSGIDAVMDSLVITIDTQSGHTGATLNESIVITVNDQTATFNVNIDTTGIIINEGNGDPGTPNPDIPADSLWTYSISGVYNGVGYPETSFQNIPGSQVPQTTAEFQTLAEGAVAGNVTFQGLTITYSFNELHLTNQVSGAIGDTISGHASGTYSATGVVNAMPINLSSTFDITYRWVRTQ